MITMFMSHPKFLFENQIVTVPGVRGDCLFLSKRGLGDSIPHMLTFANAGSLNMLNSALISDVWYMSLMIEFQLLWCLVAKSPILCCRISLRLTMASGHWSPCRTFTSGRRSGWPTSAGQETTTRIVNHGYLWFWLVLTNTGEGPTS